MFDTMIVDRKKSIHRIVNYRIQLLVCLYQTFYLQTNSQIVKIIQINIIVVQPAADFKKQSVSWWGQGETIYCTHPCTCIELIIFKISGYRVRYKKYYRDCTICTHTLAVNSYLIRQIRCRYTIYIQYGRGVNCLFFNRWYIVRASWGNLGHLQPDTRDLSGWGPKFIPLVNLGIIKNAVHLRTNIWHMNKVAYHVFFSIDLYQK